MLGIYGQLTYVPSFWILGLQPLVLMLIGLPLIAVAFVLQVLQKRRSRDESIYGLSDSEQVTTDSVVVVRCRKCGILNEDSAKSCSECGAPL